MTAAVGIAQSGVNNVSWRNRIINGGMVLDQRNAGASVTPVSGQYLVDRWRAGLSAASKYSVQQNAGSVTPPTGFSNYLGATSLSAYAVSSGDIFFLGQRIEGFNTSDLGFGTASAQTITVSFWVRSSLTGTFCVAIGNGAYNRSYVTTYSVSAANTWEFKTVTIPGDTTGTWVGATNGIGLHIEFSLGAGSTYQTTANTWAAGEFYSVAGAQSVVGTNGATFYITGVQLERGTTATPFEYRDYGRELIMCQRYYIQINGSAANPAIATGTQVNTTTAVGLVPLPVSMRTTSPTITGGVAVSDTFAYNTGLTTSSASLTSNCLNLSGTMAASGAQGRPIVFLLNGASAYLGIATEL